MSDKNVLPEGVEPEVKEKLVNLKIKVVVELERIFDPNRSQNNLMMTMGACTFSDDSGEVSKIVGEVLHGIPAHSVIRDKETGEDWVLNYGGLFEEYKSCRKRLAETEKAKVDAAVLAGEDNGEEIRDELMGLDEGAIFEKE